MKKSEDNKKAIYPFEPWKISEESFNSEYLLRNGTLFSQGNGYLGIRGSFEEGGTGKGVEGTYINGVYESEKIQYGEIAYGYAENSQTMLNLTNGKVVKLLVEDEEFSMFSGEFCGYRRALSLKDGLLERELIWTSPKGIKVKISIERVVSLKNKHLMAIRYSVTLLNTNCRLRLISAVDGATANLTVENDPRIGSGLRGNALEIVEKSFHKNGAVMIRRTRNSGITVACSMTNRINETHTLYTVGHDTAMSCEYTVEALINESVVLEKYIAYVDSRDTLEDIGEKAAGITDDACVLGFDSIVAGNREALDDFWYRSDIQIVGNPSHQQALRVSMFHLYQSVGKDGKTNIAAKGLTGEGYEGHYFWDTETYILPFFLFSNPEIAKALLQYRYAILDEARVRAGQMAQKGVLFPWRTINGEECSAYYPAGTAQYHINADIAFAIQQYMRVSDDEEFLLSWGAEILFETARFWSSLGFYNPQKDNAFCINCVTGPDEYNALVDNNCYTNMMARANLHYAFEVFNWMWQKHPGTWDELSRKLNLTGAEAGEWKKAGDSIYIPGNGDGLYPQDEGFLNRVPWDFENTPKEKYPLLLHYHPLVIYRHKVCKQADLILALFMLWNEFSLKEKRINFDFYEKLTTHDSSLSTSIFCILASELGYHEKALDYFNRSIRLDLDDNHGNTKDGIHAANMAGTCLCVLNGFAGIRIGPDGIWFNPVLPPIWEGYAFKVQYKNRLIQVEVRKEGYQMTLLEGQDLQVMINGVEEILRAQQTLK